MSVDLVTEPPTAPVKRLQYLPALDGLRALAVIMVVAYHLDMPWARGGFLGVDLFFVISGFLITTLLLREREDTGRLAIGSFWFRRFKRLVPPVVVMVLATVVATRLWGVPEQWNSVRVDATAALGYVANWRFVVADQSYFASTLGPSPLRHTWSLALEEQWYFVWPVVVAGLCVLAARSTRRRWLPLGVISALAVVSAGLMAVLYDAADPSRVYYGTDTRGQQLLVGAALACVVFQVPTLRSHRWVKNRYLMNGALAAFVCVAAVVDDEAAWLYHGGLLVLSLLAAVVVAGVSVPATESPLPWLTAEPLLWLGRRSYAMYLWHWPVIVFVGAPMGLDLTGLPLVFIQIPITLLLADMSYRLVESPARRPRRSQVPFLAGWSVAAVGAVLVASIILIAPTGRRQVIADVVRPGAASTLVPDVAAPSAQAVAADPIPRDGSALEGSAVEQASAAMAPWPDAIIFDDVLAEAGPITAASAPVQERLLLLGDSTAVVMSTGQPVSARWHTEAFARLGCSTTRGATIDTGSSRGTDHPDECAGWRDEWALSRDIVDPDVAVVMTGAWEVLDHVVDDQTYRFPSDEWTVVVRAAVADAARVARGTDVDVYLTTLPCMQQSGNSDFSALARNDVDRVNAFNTIVYEEASRSVDVEVLPLDELLCPFGAPLTGADGRNIRYDGVHLTPEGVTLTWNWILDELSRQRSTPTT